MKFNNDQNDQNNLLFAIVLSLAVLMAWQYFFATPRVIQEQTRREFSKEADAQRAGERQGPPGVAAPVAAPSTAAPVGAGAPPAAVLPREEALKASPRVAIRTPSLEGSIALKSGRIDDLVLVKYRETVDPNSNKVVLLSPAGAQDPYFAEYGWVPQGGAQTKVPNRDTLWTADANADVDARDAGDAHLG